jgi:2-polyprenyl-6-methoxyphenol hydroxylase-like FAD-dependent oxidoreductase
VEYVVNKRLPTLVYCEEDTMPLHSQVLIVGAGPTGLLLAGDLAAAGVSVTLLERRPAHDANLTRAFAVHARTLETLDARGLADDLVTTGARVGALRLLGQVDLDLSWLPSRYPYLLVTPQYETERLLEARARQQGADIVRGVEVQSLQQNADGVEVHTDRGGWRASYVVGADGVGSTVRQALGMPFPGRSAVRSVMLADVKLAHAPTDTLTVNAAGDAFGFLAPFGDGWYRLIAWDKQHPLPDDAPVDLDELRATLRRALGTDFGMHDPRWTSRFHSDERQVPQYRSGRVFLAGDAAHVHSPAGGQGMNTGLQDAANLSWKLAAAVQGWAPPGLLDSYQQERHPVGRLVLRLSGGLLRVATTPPALLPAVRALVATALRIPPLAHRAAGLLSGIAISYPRLPSAHPLTGRRAPDVRLRDGGRLYQVLRTGRFVLVTTTETPGGPDRVLIHRPVVDRLPSMLVRPDGYVAWAADIPDAAAIATALTRWCGWSPPLP